MESMVAMNADTAATEECAGRGHGWPFMHLLRGVWVCLGLACVWFAWHAYHTYQVAHLSHLRHVRAEALCVILKHLDEGLARSVEMAAVTGEQRWEARYQQVAPAWADALHEMQDLTPLVWRDG